MSCTCSPNTPSSARDLRRGSRLADGNAHILDHERWSRRAFLSQMGLAAAGVSFSLAGRPARAMTSSPLLKAFSSLASDRILILIQLSGGNDGLNTIIPVNNDIYYSRRPTIGIPKAQAVLLDDETGLHPAMASLNNLWGNGSMAVVHDTGYANATRSHFEGTVNLSTARNQDTSEESGWLGRYLTDEYFANGFSTLDYPLAVRIGGPATLFQSPFGNLSVTFGDAAQFERFVQQGGFFDAEDVPATVYGSALSFVRQITNASYRYVAAVQDAADLGSNLASYPNNGFASNLAVIARMLRGGLPTPLYTVSKGGFDTHSNQGAATGGHANNLGELADGISAFFEDLAQDGLDRRVMVMTFSEFGRTLIENGSRGTDHGAAAPMMLFSPGLRGGLYGVQSDLVNLYGGDPLYTTDYRSAYASLLDDWFGMSAGETDDVLGRRFDRLGFVEDKMQVGTEAAALPALFTLEQNYPNPFNPATEIAFHLDHPAAVSLRVFDLQGRLVQTLADRSFAAGRHVLSFHAGDLPSGTYLYRLETPRGLQSRRMVLVK